MGQVRRQLAGLMQPTVIGSALRRKQRLLACLLLGQFLFASPFIHVAVAQERSLAQYSMRLYQAEQGLPQNEVRSIAQTPDGYLWFGTRDGLARFDGVKFTVFRQETTPGIGHNMFGAMLVDRAGRLWIATGDGLSCFEHGQFRRYTERDGLPANAVHSLLEDRGGTLWVGTWNGLAVFDGRRFRKFTRNDGLPEGSISGLAEDGTGGLWVGTYGNGLSHIADGKISLLTTREGLPANFIQTIFHDRSGNLWIGTQNGSALLNPAGKLQILRDLPGKAICFYQDREDVVWAATDKTFGRYRRGANLVFERQEGPNQDVETVFEDRDGSLWVGTSGAGVARYRSGAFVPYTTREGLADDRTSTIFQDSRGDIWIGGAHGLTRKAASGVSIVPKKEFGGGAVRSIAEDDGGGLWVGTAKGVARFDRQNWTQMGPRDGIPRDVHVLYHDRAGRTWIGSPEGVTIWDHGKISNLTRKQGLPGNYVMSILEDRRGSMWIGTITGLARVDASSITNYTTANGLSSNYIQCLYQDSEDTLWICTPSGLNRLRDGHFHAFSTADGMVSDGTLQLLEDGQNRFWISSYRGIFRVNRSDLNALATGAIGKVNAVSYGTEDGMKSTACAGLGMQPAGWKTRDGTLWFPTDTGVVSINPSAMPSLDPVPVPVLEAVLQDGVESPSAAVGPNIHRIDFVFSAPTSIGAEAIEFRYRLQGYEDEWHDAGTMRLISFTNLPQGKYRFAVSARRPGNPWGPEGASWFLQIQPHVYETRWFYTAMGLLAAMLIWLAHTIRVRATEQRFKTIMGERSRVAQELHDTLLQSVSGTAMEIRGALRVLSQGYSEGGLQQISLALDHLGSSMADARQAIWDLRSPASSEQRLDHALVAAAKRVCAGGPEVDYEVLGEPRQLSRAIEKNAYRIGVEAITNAVRHAQCNKVSMRLHYRKNSLLLFVHDDGVGFNPATAESSSLANHWGLAGMKERAHKCSGQLTIESTPAAGTIVQFEAPFG